MGSSGVKPSLAKRVAAIAAIALAAIVVVSTIARGLDEPQRVLLSLLLLIALIGATWIALTRIGTKRTVAVVLAVATLVALCISIIAVDGLLVSTLARIAGLLGAVALARYALGTDVRSLKAADVPGTPVPPATRGVLFMNLKSGGGKAERFHLVDECTRRGIEPIVLEPGEDWLQRVRDVAASGVDVLGMAGGDGSQAMVGTVAAEFGLPMVVVPAGTRNHLALDLGLDRDDVVGALDAYGEAVERTTRPRRRERTRVRQQRVARAVRGDRALARRTATPRWTRRSRPCPQVLGPDTEPFDLRFTGPDGDGAPGRPRDPDLQQPVRHHRRAARAAARGSTPDSSASSRSCSARRAAAPAFLAAFATGHPERYDGLQRRGHADASR